MTKTEHYHLNQWDAADPVRREDFNADNAAIDMALHAIQSETAEGLAALNANLGAAGKNARIEWGSYTGSGTYGSGSPNKLTFSFQPLLVIGYSTVSGGEEFHFLRPAAKAGGHYNFEMTVTWGDKSVSWYATSVSSQYNESRQYVYIAFGVDA